jgi:hypothetical protein
LYRHGVGRLAGDDALERCAQIRCAGRVRFSRVVGEHVEQGAADDFFALGQRGSQIGVAGIDDGEVRVGPQQEEQARNAVKDIQEIDAVRFGHGGDTRRN